MKNKNLQQTSFIIILAILFTIFNTARTYSQVNNQAESKMLLKINQPKVYLSEMKNAFQSTLFSNILKSNQIGIADDFERFDFFFDYIQGRTWNGYNSTILMM